MKKRVKQRIRTLFAILLIVSLFGCGKKQVFGVTFFSNFDKDKVVVYYNNLIVLDSILTTDESTGLSFLGLNLEKVPNAYLLVCVNDTIKEKIEIDKYLCRVDINFNLKRSNKLILKKDSICAPRIFR
jgi:hypothetical protein